MSVNELATRYPYFNANEISAFQQQFSSFDKGNTGKIHPRDMAPIATKAGESYQVLTSKLSAMSLSDDNGNVGFEDFLKAISALRQEKGAKKATGDKIILHGHSENVLHTINEDEKESFIVHINQELANDKHLQNRVPIDKTSMQLFAECKDGLILAKLINASVPNTIDERVLNLNGNSSLFKMTENGNVVINSAKAIGCSVVNIGAQDLIDGREHLILGLIWQIIKIGLQAHINIVNHPELFRLLETGETLESFLRLPPDQILLRWFNYHLKKAGWHRKVATFGNDVKVHLNAKN
jgi:plastin-1